MPVEVRARESPYPDTANTRTVRGEGAYTNCGKAGAPHHLWMKIYVSEAAKISEIDSLRRESNSAGD